MPAPCPPYTTANRDLLIARYIWFDVFLVSKILDSTNSPNLVLIFMSEDWIYWIFHIQILGFIFCYQWHIFLNSHDMEQPLFLTVSMEFTHICGLLKFISMLAGRWLTHANVPAFGWHQGPAGPSKALWAYSENFVTDKHTNTLSIIYRW